jgi:Fe2+ or Zn2+ uptake regulation protein
MLANVSMRCTMYTSAGKAEHSEHSRNIAMAPKDLKVLRLLMDYPTGLYGSEMVSLSDGYIGRGTVYTLLARLVERGFVREVEEPPTPALQFSRTRHFITADGRRAVHEYAEEMGFQLKGA